MEQTATEAAKTGRNILTTALKKLEEKSFAQFKTKLRLWDVSKKYKKIPRDQLEQADPQTVADLICAFYGAGYGIKVTRAILDALNEKKVREELLKDSQRGREHILERHGSDLVKLVFHIDTILHDLYHKKLLTDNQYRELQEQPTTQEKTERLLEITRCWDNSSKDRICEALVLYNPGDIERVIHNARMQNARGNILEGIGRLSLSERKRRKKPAKGSARKHIVDRHEGELIKQILMVDPVLDDLLDQNLLTPNQHKKLSNKCNSQEKMRSLCDTVRGWSDPKKDIVDTALEKYNHEIIWGLEVAEDQGYTSQSRNHFIAVNQDELIKTITNIDPVLHDLMDQELLTQNQFTKLMKKSSYEEKMRSLCDTIYSWSCTNKDKVYDALRRHNYRELRSMEKDYIPGQLMRNTSYHIILTDIADKSDFLHRYRLDLIHRVKTVDPVLLHLQKERLLSKERFRLLITLPSSRSKIYELLELARSWSQEERARLFDALRKYNYEVVSSLERYGRDFHESITEYPKFVLQGSKRPVATTESTQSLLQGPEFPKAQFYSQDLEASGPFPGWWTSPKYQSLVKHSTTRAREEHFLSRHWLELINEVTNVNEILWDLWQHGLLTKQLYNHLMSLPSPKSKMLEVMKAARFWSTLQKDRALRIIRKHNAKEISAMERADHEERLPQAASEDHFLDRHRSELIQEVTNVDPVLLDLCIQGLLTDESYDYLSSEPSPEAKMGALMSVIKYWDKESKDRALLIIREYNIEEISAMERADLTRRIRGPRRQTWMKRDYNIAWAASGPFPVWYSMSDSAGASEDHFLDRHRSELIQEVTNVDWILHDLWQQGLLTDESYEYLKSEPSVRRLMDAIRSWDKKSKDRALLIIREYNESKISAMERAEQLSSGQIEAPDWEKLESSMEPSKPPMIITRSLGKRLLPRTVPETVSPYVSTTPLAMVATYPGPQNLSDVGPDEEEDQAAEGGADTPLVTVTATAEIPPAQMECRLCGQPPDPGDVLIPAINGKSFRLELKSAGLFCCQKTGIKFQVTASTVIDYQLAFWSDYLADILDSKHEIIGPLFNITTEKAGVVSAVYLPHYLCLKAFTGDTTNIKCAHFINENMILEKPTKVDPFYVVLENPTFSCLGPLLSFAKKKVPIHGIVLIYFQIICQGELEYQEYKINLYLLPSAPSLEDLDKKKRNVGYQRIEKPPYPNDPVYTRMKYLITGRPGASVRPKTLKFDSRCHKDLYQFAEISIKGDDISIHLDVAEEDTKDTVWAADLTKGDIRQLTRSLSQPPIPEASGGSLEEHFVDRHRPALIDRMTYIDPILDDILAQKLLKQEQYDTIRKREPCQEKMRQLYSYITIWGKTDKDKLFHFIQKHNEPLVRDLLGL